ncbi:hypothetical protein VNO77_16491 [Canavalia gladiata]|uniref:Uncharacterized protein n=1 Tax=Canavalia gladiata TaxID=3824 RepID=A0AAN9M5Y7_CANGL
MSDSEITYQSYFVAPSEFSTNNNGDIRDCATSRPAANNIAARNEKQGKTKAGRKAVGSQKTIGGKKKRPALGKGTPSPTNNNVPPRLCIGLYVCVDYDGRRSLGTATSYDPKTKLFQVEFDDERKEYMDQKDVLKNMAREPDIMEAQEELKASMNAEKSTLNQEKRPATDDAPTSTRKRGNTSTTNVTKVPHVACRMRAING